MVHAGLVKLGAVLCLLVQIWGGTGLDRASFCIRPASAPKACASGCCQKKPESTSSTRLSSHKTDCCLKAKLPDNPTLLQSARDSEAPKSVFTFRALGVDPIAFSLTSAPDQSPPGTSAPRVAPCLASTRLRL